MEPASSVMLYTFYMWVKVHPWPVVYELRYWVWS